MPSVAGSSCMPLISMPQVSQAAGPLISMPQCGPRQCSPWQVSQMQDPPIVSSGPTVSEKVKIDDDVEVISVRSASAKRARPRDQATVNVSKHARSSASTSRRSTSLPAGTTLEGLAQSRGHLRPVLNMRRTDLCMPKKFLRLT